MTEVCPSCGGEYSGVSYHWRGSPEHRPNFTDIQHQIITGILMGDGSINTTSSNPRLVCASTTPKYLEYLEEAFGLLSNGVRLRKNPEEAAQQDRDSGFNKNADAQDYSAKYAFRTKCHPGLGEYAEWYSSGEKEFPDSIDLTPVVLKHWYCGDGTYDNKNSHNRIRIAMFNEREHKPRIEAMFSKSGLPEPDLWNESHKDCSAVWSVKQSSDLFEYMGDPLPGFGYKWPDRYCEQDEGI